MFSGGGAPGSRKPIRFYQKPDLTAKREKVYVLTVLYVSIVLYVPFVLYRLTVLYRIIRIVYFSHTGYTEYMTPHGESP